MSKQKVIDRKTRRTDWRKREGGGKKNLSALIHIFQPGFPEVIYVEAIHIDSSGIYLTAVVKRWWERASKRYAFLLTTSGSSGVGSSQAAASVSQSDARQYI